MAFLCIDIGGTNTLVGVGNGEFQEVERIKSSKFLKDIDSTLESIIEETTYDIQDFGKIAVAAAGPLDREKGVFYPPNLSEHPSLDEVQLRDPLSKFGDLHIINDCTAAVLGERYYGGEESDNLVYITISSGIGLGAILEGEVIEGFSGNFGEVGHMNIGGDVPCGCGSEGHWEAYSSGNRLPIMAEEVFGADFKTALDLFKAYNNDNEKAIKVIEKMQDVNAVAMTNIVNLYNPEKIVIGGPVALSHEDVVINDLEKEVEKRAMNESPEIKPASLGDQSVLHGLRAICNEKHDL